MKFGHRCVSLTLYIFFQKPSFHAIPTGARAEFLKLDNPILERGIELALAAGITS
jgi:hypothetical protein